MDKKINTLKVDYIKLEDIFKYQRMLKKPKPKQAEKAKRFLREFGFIMPIAVDQNRTIVIGEIFFTAAKELGYDSLPVVLIDHLSEAQIKALRIAYDRIHEDAEWDRAALRLEFEELQILIPDMDLTLTGFDMPEIEAVLNFDMEADTDPLNAIPDIDEGHARVKTGDLYKLGDHMLYCGDALESKSYEVLLGIKKLIWFLRTPHTMSKLMGMWGIPAAFNIVNLSWRPAKCRLMNLLSF